MRSDRYTLVYFYENYKFRFVYWVIFIVGRCNVSWWLICSTRKYTFSYGKHIIFLFSTDLRKFAINISQVTSIALHHKIINYRWWFVLVGILSVLSLLYYFFALMLASNQRQFVIRYLRCAGAVSDFRDPKTEKYLHDFIKRFLRPDGVFILRLIEVWYQFIHQFAFDRIIIIIGV